jgi:hypothetical protein
MCDGGTRREHVNLNHNHVPVRGEMKLIAGSRSDGRSPEHIGDRVESTFDGRIGHERSKTPVRTSQWQYRVYHVHNYNA